MRNGIMILGLILWATTAPAAAETLRVGPAVVHVPRNWSVGFLHGEAPSEKADLSIIDTADPSGRVSVMIGLGKGAMMESLLEEFSPRDLARLRQRTVSGRRALRGVPPIKPDAEDEKLSDYTDPARDCLFIDYGTHTLSFFVFYKGKLPAKLARDVERMLAAGPPRKP